MIRLNVLRGKRIFLLIAGGIAAYKSLELIRQLREQGAAVRCILTAAGSEFMIPLAVAALNEDKVFTELFSLTDESEMGRIGLSWEADLVLVTPVSTNLLAKTAGKLALDLATTAPLATNKPLFAVPAMNVRMWELPATQAKIPQLAGPENHWNALSGAQLA